MKSMLLLVAVGIGAAGWHVSSSELAQRYGTQSLYFSATRAMPVDVADLACRMAPPLGRYSGATLPARSHDACIATRLELDVREQPGRN